jgi:hypothetical protein
VVSTSPDTPLADPAADAGEDLLIRIQDLARIDVRPGDAVVYRPTGLLSHHEWAQLKAEWLFAFPNNPLVRLLPGEVFAIRPEPVVGLSAAVDLDLAERVAAQLEVPDDHRYPCDAEDCLTCRQIRKQ